jgi:hypothetical protein
MLNRRLRGFCGNVLAAYVVFLIAIFALVLLWSIGQRINARNQAKPLDPDDKIISRALQELRRLVTRPDVGEPYIVKLLLQEHEYGHLQIFLFSNKLIHGCPGGMNTPNTNELFIADEPYLEGDLIVVGLLILAEFQHAKSGHSEPLDTGALQRELDEVKALLPADEQRRPAIAGIRHGLERVPSFPARYDGASMASSLLIGISAILFFIAFVRWAYRDSKGAKDGMI